MFSKGTRSGNGRASIPHVLSGVISLLLGAGTLNCGVSMARIVHIGQIGQVGVFQGDFVDAEFSADGSTFLLGKSRQSVVKVLECKQFVPMNRLAHVSGGGRVHCWRQAALGEGFRDLSTHVPYFLITS